MPKLNQLQKQVYKLLTTIVEEEQETEITEISNLKKCNICNNVLTVIVRQTRKSDEGMTTFMLCDTCKKSFKK